MTPCFPLGIEHLWDELQQMQSAGLYWIHADQQPDAALLCQQVIAAQAADTQAALICVGSAPDAVASSLPNAGPRRLPLFSLPAHHQALSQLRRDLMRAFKPQRRLLLLLVAAQTWQDSMQGTQLPQWLKDMAAWLCQQQSTLLIISYGSGGDALLARLQGEHGSLQGLAHLRWPQDSPSYQVAFWFNRKGVSARQELALMAGKHGWAIQANERVRSHSNNDEASILCQHSVLPGDRVPSEHWQLFADNAALARAGTESQAATLVFALQQQQDIAAVARELHQLRRHCGQSVKLIVREVTVSARQADERLLLACGANLVVAHQVSLSRFLILLEGMQGQHFVRHLPSDITALLAAGTPLSIKGVLELPSFCTVLADFITHSVLHENAKGVLVALQPAPGLKAAQALALCRLDRLGDIATVADGMLFLFLFSLDVNDLKFEFSHIFQVPITDLFQHYRAWYQDLDMLAELEKMQHHQPGTWLPPHLVTRQQVERPEHQAAPVRHQPHAICLPVFGEKE